MDDDFIKCLPSVSMQQIFRGSLEKESDHSLLLALAKKYGQVRRVPHIWQYIINDLLQWKHMNFLCIAKELNVTPKTLSRILRQETKQPAIETGLRLLFLHMRHCKDRYLRNFDVKK